MMAYSAQLKTLLRCGAKSGFVIPDGAGKGKLIRLHQYSVYNFATKQAITQALRYGLVMFESGRYWMTAKGYKEAQNLPPIIPSKDKTTLPDHTICKDCSQVIYPIERVRKNENVEDLGLREFMCWQCGSVTEGYGMDRHISADK